MLSLATVSEYTAPGVALLILITCWAVAGIALYMPRKKNDDGC